MPIATVLSRSPRNCKHALLRGSAPSRSLFLFHVIKQELETWWIGEAAAISAVTGVAIPFPGGNVEQDVLDPKAYIVRRLAGAKKAYTSNDAAAAAERIDLTVLQNRCPGFVRFAQRMVG